VARGHVFVTYTGSSERPRLLVDRLAAAHLDVVPDADLRGPSGWTRASHFADGASAVVIAFDDDSVLTTALMTVTRTGLGQCRELCFL
jgi:hypothetical protein